MKILHMLSGGSVGGIESLCQDIGKHGREEHVFAFLFQGGTVAQEMQIQGYECHFLYEKSRICRFTELLRLICRDRFDAVVVHHEGVGIYLYYLMAALLSRNTAFVKYLHCSYEQEYFFVGNRIKDKIHYYLLYQTLKKSDGLIAVSGYVKSSYCKEFGIPENKVQVIYNGIDRSKSKIRTESISAKTEAEVLRLVYMGRLVYVKGVDRLLKAVSYLKQEGKRIQLHILGDGPQRSELELLSDSLGIGDMVFFEGFRRDKEKYLTPDRIFVYPSVWQEAFGISLIEAMEAGMLCVAAKVGGIPEIINDGINGILFETDHDGSALAKALVKAQRCLSEDADGKIAKKIRDRAKDFDIVYTIETLENTIRKMRKE